MASRVDLQYALEDLLGSRNVYYQPPASLVMKYPAIVYSRVDIQKDYADDSIYNKYNKYQIIVIDVNPDSLFVDKVAELPLCRYVRPYIADNLNHTVFEIYF